MVDSESVVVGAEAQARVNDLGISALPPKEKK
jgi:hypothetical protein